MGQETMLIERIIGDKCGYSVDRLLSYTRYVNINTDSEYPIRRLKF